MGHVAKHGPVGQDHALGLALRAGGEQNHRWLLRVHLGHRAQGQPQGVSHQPGLVRQAETLAQIFQVKQPHIAQSGDLLGQPRLGQEYPGGDDGLDPGRLAGALHAIGAGGVVEHAGHPAKGREADHERHRGGQVGQQHAHVLSFGADLGGQAPQGQGHLEQIAVGIDAGLLVLPLAGAVAAETAHGRHQGGKQGIARPVPERPGRYHLAAGRRGLPPVGMPVLHPPAAQKPRVYCTLTISIRSL